MQVAIYWVGVSFESRFPLKIKSQSFLRLFVFVHLGVKNRSPHTCGKSPQDIHRLIAIPIKREMERAEGAGVVELREIDLGGEVGGAPVALLGGIPAMARVATKRNKQQISLVKSRL